MTRFALLTLAAALAAPPASAITIANPASDQLSQLGDIPRRAALRGALLDSGFQCVRVEQAARQGPWGNLMMWRAKCDLKDVRFDYGVFIGPDGSIQARRCGDMKLLGLPPCRPLVRQSASRQSSR
ncbi:hypothetical protein [uncultured Sphingomonas sp.]|uniref:hypothetical protein n=1 Tax=uncultured Sphingomonas sp. TaxID=158754 RepID=UPI0025DC4FEA|nr:hypothetical protein [uncultured Sphingomonas sp.]